MNAWWNSLEQRERWFVGGLGAFVAATVLFLLVLEPLFAAAGDYRERVARAERDLARIQRDAAEYRALGGSTSAPAGDNQPLVVIVDRTARQFNLKENLRRTQPVGENSIRVQLTGASFDQLIRWLGALSANHGVALDSATISREEKPGSADASLTLQRAEP